MKPDRPAQLLDEIASEQLKQSVNLLPQIQARLDMPGHLQNRKIHPAVSLLAVLVALVLLTSVAYAIGRSLGYIPGIGMVDDSKGILALDKPVTLKKGRLTLTVLELLSDSTRTYVKFRLEGLSTSMAEISACTQPPHLRLSSGVDLNFMTSEGGLSWESGTPVHYEPVFIFPPLPRNTTQVEILLACQDLRVLLPLVPARADLSTPVVKVESTPSTLGTLPVQPIATGLRLQNAYETPHSYLLVLNLVDAGDLPGSILFNDGLAYMLPLQVKDSNGSAVSYKIHTDVQTEVAVAGAYAWAIEVEKPVAAPLTLTLDTIEIQKMDTARFQVDTGVQPQPGQVWKLDRPLTLGDTQVTLDSLEILPGGYLLRWHTNQPGDRSMAFTQPEYPPSTTKPTTGQEIKQTIYSQDYFMDGPIPTGTINIELTQTETVSLQVNWSLTWSPPVSK